MCWHTNQSPNHPYSAWLHVINFIIWHISVRTIYVWPKKDCACPKTPKVAWTKHVCFEHLHISKDTASLPCFLLTEQDDMRNVRDMLASPRHPYGGWLREKYWGRLPNCCCDSRIQEWLLYISATKQNHFDKSVNNKTKKLLRMTAKFSGYQWKAGNVRDISGRLRLSLQIKWVSPSCGWKMQTDHGREKRECGTWDND